MATIIHRRGRAYDGDRAYVGGGGLSALAGIVSLVVWFIVGVLLLGIVLVFFKANPANGIVDFILDAGSFFAGPFDDIFSPGGHRLNVAVNWGLAALVYAIVGGMISSLLER